MTHQELIVYWQQQVENYVLAQKLCFENDKEMYRQLELQARNIYNQLCMLVINENIKSVSSAEFDPEFQRVVDANFHELLD